MVEYIEKSTVIKMIDDFVKDSRDHGFPNVDIFDIDMMKNMINKIPIADVTSIIRCKDCKHFNLHERKCESDEVHCDNEGGADYTIYFDVDDFCCFGERRE